MRLQPEFARHAYWLKPPSFIDGKHLDAILHRYVEEEKSAPQIISEGFDEATVMRVIKLIDRSEYKRRQAAPGLKVTSRAFGFGRRMPIAQNYVQRVPQHGEPSPVLE